jgi:kynurenine 3-monooxygenase
LRKEKISAGRSINLALSDRGIMALEKVGIMDEIRKIAIPMHGRLMHHIDGSTVYQAYGNEGQFINSVSRGELNKKLVSLAEELGVQIFFNYKCESIDWEKNNITLQDQSNFQFSTFSFQLLFGSDGAYSAARLQHQLQHNRFQYNQYYIDFGYKELTIPPRDNGGYSMEKNALHIWPRGNFMLIALPNTDGSFTCTLFFPFDGDPSFSSLDNKEKVEQFFSSTFADAREMMPHLAEEYFNNANASLVTVKCFPWIRDDKFALIGDAAHAIVPFFGQGMNCGFEDCLVLNKLIDKHQENWDLILPEYQQLRKPDGDAIADLALNNFVEMRDKVADPAFLLQKRIEAAFSKKHPDKWIPAYSQVTFSPHIRYSAALQNGQQQQKIMDEIMATPGIESIWDSSVIEQMMLEKITPGNV